MPAIFYVNCLRAAQAHKQSYLDNPIVFMTIIPECTFNSSWPQVIWTYMSPVLSPSKATTDTSMPAAIPAVKASRATAWAGLAKGTTPFEDVRVLALCAAAGALLGLSSPGIDQSYLAWFALAPLLLAVSVSKTKGQAFVRATTDTFWATIWFICTGCFSPSAYDSAAKPKNF